MYRLLLIAMLFLAGCGSPKPYVVDPTQGMTVIPQVQGKSFLVLQRGYAAAAELSDLAKVQDTKAENTKATSTATGMIKDDVKGRALFPDLWDKLVLYKQLNSTLEMAGAKASHELPVNASMTSWADVLKSAQQASMHYVVVLGYVQGRADTKTADHSSNVGASVVSKTLLPIYPMEFYSTALKYDRPFAVYDAQSGKLLLDGMLKPDVVTSYRVTLFGQSEAADFLTNCGKALAVESRSFVEQVTPVVAP